MEEFYLYMQTVNETQKIPTELRPFQFQGFTQNSVKIFYQKKQILLKMTQIEQIRDEIERRRAKYKELISKSFGVEQEYFKGMAVVADEMMLFVNSLPAEQPSEELEIEIKRKYKNNIGLMMPIESFRKLILYFTNWQKEQTINKACEWLNKNVVEYHPRKGELRPIVNTNAFREAMENNWNEME